MMFLFPLNKGFFIILKNTMWKEGLSMKINYPIKYAAMPIFDGQDVITCYIASKCYLLNDATNYKEDGSSTKEYEVSFPYQMTHSNIWRQVEPCFNFYGECLNSIKTSNVFSTYEEALDYAQKRNEELFEQSISYLPIMENMVQIIQEQKENFDAKLAKYKELEQQIFLYTINITNSQRKQINNIIKVDKNNVKILSHSIYSIFDYLQNENFAVFNVSPKQYDMLTKLILEKKFDQIPSITKDAKEIALHRANDSITRLVTECETGSYYINHRSSDGHLFYDKKLEKGNSKESELFLKDEKTFIFYTTETVEDFINSYEFHHAIYLSEDQPVLTRTRENS